MLVSDDMPDEVELGNDIDSIGLVETPTVIDPASILLCYNKEEYPTIPVQANKYIVNKDCVKLVGVMLLADFAWVAEQLDIRVDHLEIRTDDRAYKVGVGPYAIERFVAKDINATTVHMHLSLKKHS